MLCNEAHIWIENFLTNRTFRVRVGTELSDPEKVVSGIPQGTCLGPLLMLVMNSDIDTKIKNGTTGTLADDTKITNVLKSNADNYKMQEDLISLEKWSEMNNVKMNDDKFVLICYNKNPQITDNHYHMKSGTVIHESDGTRDLGVWMSNNATFTEHISNVTTSCKKIMSMIFRSFTSRNDQLMLTLYKSLILSKIDYCSVLWNPTNLTLWAPGFFDL